MEEFAWKHSLQMQPPTSSTANRFEALDGWRGICACLVVLFHFHGYSPIYSWGLIRNSYLFVDFFFVLSGFVIAWNYATRLDSWHGGAAVPAAAHRPGLSLACVHAALLPGL
jgi:peptidoglycan/LPS O-acetylase OafA/YrhL